MCFINFCVYYAVIQENAFVRAVEFALISQFSSTNTTPSSNSLKLNSETPFSTLLFALSLPPLPCQHHVCPGRSMWRAAGIMLTFSAPRSSASLIQTSQSTVHHLGQLRSETTWEPDITLWKTEVITWHQNTFLDIIYQKQKGRPLWFNFLVLHDCIQPAEYLLDRNILGRERSSAPGQVFDKAM